MYKLPILETVAEAYRFFGKNLLTIGKYALPMIVVVIGYSIVFQNLASAGLSHIMMHGVFSVFCVALLAQAIIVIAGVSFAITVHRLFFSDLTLAALLRASHGNRETGGFSDS